MTVHVRRDLHLRDLRLLLQGGEVHAVGAYIVRGVEAVQVLSGVPVKGEVVCTVRLCPDAQRYIDRIMRRVRDRIMRRVRDGTHKDPTRAPGQEERAKIE